jgi:predicted ATPase
MIYLNEFDLLTHSMEEDYFFFFVRTCFTNCYPFRFFPDRLKGLEFDDITILCGSNGSGKSTLLNIIAEKLELKRETPYNKTYFFNPYIERCNYGLNVYEEEETARLMSVSRIITSDDVFNHIIALREKNEELGNKRKIIFDEKSEFNRFGVYKGPRSVNVDNPDSIKRYIDYYDMTRMSASQYVKQKIGEEQRTYSNGENGFRYFVDAIQPGGLYLLDEPENSLSPEMQLQLTQYLLSMARFYKCQFIIATHSPFILSIPHAKIYNMDEYPVKICKWTEYENVRVYYDFFKQHESEFQE